MAPDDIRYWSFSVGELETNAYLVYSFASRVCLVIDPGAESDELTYFIANEKLRPAMIVLTHGHGDHNGGVKSLLEQFPMPLLIHRLDEPMLQSPYNLDFSSMLNLPPPPPADRLIEDGDILEAADIRLKVIHTPGHTPGSVTLQLDDWLFTGDTLFAEDVGRTDLPGGDPDAQRQSLEKLKLFPPDTLVLPGHGQADTMKDILIQNPYL